MQRALDEVSEGPPVPTVSAESWLLYDDTFDFEIASHRATAPASIASTTKMMTALLVVDHAEMDEVVTISRRAEATGHKQIYLRAGEEWTVGELLEAVMVVSANDAAVALAEHVGGDVAGFVELMNDEAAALGLTGTSFANPHGLEARGHHGSAADLLALARTVMSRPELARLAAQPTGEMISQDGRVVDGESTNELLDIVDGAFGVKTGWTTRAGDVIVAGAERDGRRLYAVVLGSRDANRDATALLEHGFAVFTPAERRLVPLMEDPDDAEVLRSSLPAATLARLAHLRGLAKREEAPWE
ncbi:MAG: D-alanyl-D-alanine carboxypeptidase [Acidimicrobiia bacterium]|nr:serine hydrolase [Acidimicrobiia bacterium]NNF08937.1 D-alanyl-D-alanine carboxypeptidase [Acidimicrobiia bacterium]